MFSDFHSLHTLLSLKSVMSISGLAHMLEHEAFKGSRRVGTLDWQREAPLLAAQDEGEVSLFPGSRFKHFVLKVLGHLTVFSDGNADASLYQLCSASCTMHQNCYQFVGKF